MWNGQPYRRGGIRFFPHIIPIGFPLIFPFGMGLAFWLFHTLLSVFGFLIFVAVVFFIVRTIMLGSPQSAWDSMKNTGNQWQQRFTSQQQQPPQTPYYQPSSPTGQPVQEQPAQQYGQGYQPQPQTPYYQPSPQTSQPAQEQPYYQPSEQGTPYYQQPQAHYPEQTPPMQQG